VNTRDTVKKLLAFDAGKPLPRGMTLRLPARKPSNVLVLAFVRMGGESRPWGVAIGAANTKPFILTVPEARDRELVGGLMEKVAPTLLSYLGHPKFRERAAGQVPQVWVPNASHIEMLHFLAFTYTFAKRGEPRRMAVLNALGRAANWLFQESTRPGQLSCIDASAALREAYTFPAEDIRQAHTGYLLAWLETKGTYKTRLMAAIEAEKVAISTSLDPEVEKSARLDELVEAYNKAKRASDQRTMDMTGNQIHRVLEPELRHRFNAAARAYAFLANDDRKPNPGLEDLEKSSAEHHGEYLQTESAIASDGKAWVPSPETDGHSLVAASKYLTLEADQDRVTNALVHYDRDLQQDLIDSGDGLSGRIVKIEDRSEGRKTRAVWLIEDCGAHPLRLRIGNRVVQAGYPKRKAELLDILETESGTRRFALEITAGIREGEGPLGRPPLDGYWKGRSVTFLSLNDPGYAFTKRKMLWDRAGPGTWLTHRQPWEEWSTSAGEDDFDADAAAT
jgi:hypothetical protein